MAKGTIRIGLLWHSLGHGNLGVDALTRANIAIIRSACARAGLAPTFVLLGEPSLRTPDGVDIVQGPRLRLKEIPTRRSPYLAALRHCDIVFDTSEGDSFADIYGRERFFYHAGTKIAALLLGRPLILSPQTFGPFTSPWSKRVVRWIVHRTARSFPRDNMSFAALKDLGCADKAIEVTDVAFRLPFERSERRGGPLRVGLNVSGLMYDEKKESHAADFTLDYIDYLHRLIPAIEAIEPVEFWLVPHVVGGAPGDPDDRSASLRLQERFPQVKIAPNFTSASDAKTFISGMDFFSGGRMHACIGAFSSGVPVVPIAYSRKFNGLFGSLGYGRMVDARAVGVDAALATTLKAFVERDAVRAEIEPCLARAEDRLKRYEDEIVTVLNAMAAPVNVKELVHV